jgi:hypothetical protein
LPGGYSSAVGDAPAKMRASPRRARTRPLRTEGVARTAAAQISLWGGNNGPLSTEVKSVRPGRRRPRFCRICRRSRSPRGAIVSSGHRYSLCDSLDDEQEAQGETPPWQKEQSWCTASTVRSLEMDESGQRPPQEGGEGNAAPLRDSSSVATVETSSDPRHPRPLGKNAISGGVEGARIEARRRSPLRRVESAGSGRSRARERVIGDDVSVPRTVSSVAATQLGARGQSDDSRSLNRDAARAPKGVAPRDANRCSQPVDRDVASRRTRTGRPTPGGQARRERRPSCLSRGGGQHVVLTIVVRARRGSLTWPGRAT